MRQTNAENIQHAYYAATASHYEQMHGAAGGEHSLALAFLIALLDYYGIHSILDVGSGTGRVLRHIKSCRPDIAIVGIEPVSELRDIGHSFGLTAGELIAGNALALPFSDSSFDFVVEFGALHHIARPDVAVAEMLRVARKGVFISDSNNFGQGSALSRCFKQVADVLGLWRLVTLIKTKGRGYSVSDGDGLFYSYSVFNNYRQIRAACERIHLLNTRDGFINPYRTASHVALAGIKRQ